jgi:spoIIIJ-associated protein
MELVIKETLEKILEVMKVPFSGVKVDKEGESNFYVSIETSSSNLLIGWHGETIAALQHMLKCILWKQKIGSDIQIIVDVDGYKKRQEESVIRLAERKAEYAVENQKEVKLPPMNPYFRRKVHLHLADSDKYKDKITTESTGEGQDRAIKIIPK